MPLYFGPTRGRDPRWAPFVTGSTCVWFRKAQSGATTGQLSTLQTDSPEYGPGKPRRSKRPRKPRSYFCCLLILRIFLPHGGGVKSCVFSTFPCANLAQLRGADCCIVSVGKWFIPRRALIRFARSVPLGQSLNAVTFVGNPFYSERSVQLYTPVLEYSNRMRNCLLRLPLVYLLRINEVRCI